MTHHYVGQSFDMSALEQVASLVTELYKHKGYTLATAYIPQQDIRFGVVEAVVLEGRVGEITVSSNRHYSPDFIRGSFAQAMEEHVIRNLSFERSLLLLNDHPDPKVSALLEPDGSTGSTNVLFDGATLNVNVIIGDHPAQLQFQTLSYAAPWVSM